MTLDELRALATETRSGEPCWGDPYGMAPTLAECEFLYALVRAVRPTRVLELGTGMGVSTRFIAEALDPSAYFVTVERDHEFWPAVREMMTPKLGNVALADNAPNTYAVDLVYIDSAPNHRYRDIQHWLTNGSNALVVVHDGNRDYPEFACGVGTLVPSQAGLWIGRGK